MLIFKIWARYCLHIQVVVECIQHQIMQIILSTTSLHTNWGGTCSHTVLWWCQKNIFYGAYKLRLIETLNMFMPTTCMETLFRLYSPLSFLSPPYSWNTANMVLNNTNQLINTHTYQSINQSINTHYSTDLPVRWNKICRLPMRNFPVFNEFKIDIFMDLKLSKRLVMLICCFIFSGVNLWRDPWYYRWWQCKYL